MAPRTPWLAQPMQERRSHSATGRDTVPSIVYDDSDSISSEEESVTSAATSSKKLSRSKTLYNICYPPPKNGTRQKNHRPLLQLQRVTQISRPRPIFEIVPSSRLSSSLCAEFTNAFSRKTSLSSDALAITKVGEYWGRSSIGGLEEDSSHVLAVICRSRKNDKAASASGKVLLYDGTEWTACPSKNGGYEFVSTDHGVATKIRWFSKRPQGKRTDSAVGSHKSSDAESLKQTDVCGPTLEEAQALQAQKTARDFKCSSIMANTRRHPIVARLTTNTIDIPDAYNIPLPSGSEMQEPLLASESQDMTPALRAIITATAIYVSLHEGWCPDFRPLQPATKASVAAPVRTTTLAEPVDNSKVVNPRSPNPFMRFFSRKMKDAKDACGDRPRSSHN